MDGISAEFVAIEGGRSVALEQALRTVAEADLGNGPKYTAPVVRNLTRTISARAYGRPLLELMHLLRAAEAAGGRQGWPAILFAIPVARAAAFRGVFQKGAAGCRAFGTDFHLVEDGVEIAYPDAPFRITYPRMAFLGALVEFAITALGWRAVDGVVRDWLDDRFAQGAAGRHANALSRLLYDHLNDHLPSVQVLRSFRRLTQFLAASRGEGFGLDDLDDDTVLAFWVAGGGVAGDDGRDSRTFRGVVEQFARLRTAIQAGVERRSMAAALPIGGDRSTGEIDPDSLLAVLEAHDGAADPLRMLSAAPASSVKFLTGRELEALDLLASLGPHGPALPVSVLRAETFGAAQARLTQAVRRRADAAEIARLAGLADCESYEERRAYWNRLEAQLSRVALACLAAMLEAGRREAVIELLAQAPDADLAGLRGALVPDDAAVDPDEPTVIRFPRSGMEAAFRALGDPAMAGPRIAALVAEARSALRSISRRGFGAAERREPEVMDGFAAGAPAVRQARELLLRLCGALDAAIPPDSRSARFEADREVFAGRFRELYEAAS